MVTPESNVLCINPVAPHNLNNRPLIVPRDGELQLVAEGRENQFLLSLDSRMFILDGGKKSADQPRAISFRFNQFGAPRIFRNDPGKNALGH